jgi:hypothetical protein
MASANWTDIKKLLSCKMENREIWTAIQGIKIFGMGK